MRSLAAAILIALAACEQEQPVPNEAVPVQPVAEPPALIDASAGAEETKEVDAEPAPIVPEPFHGEWNSDASACGTASEGRLRVSGGQLIFYESTGKVRRVEIDGEDAIEVTAEYQGEGETWQNKRRLQLGDGGETLTVSGEGSTLLRRRCG